jgi:hypothetical protein
VERIAGIPQSYLKAALAVGGKAESRRPEPVEQLAALKYSLPSVP